MSQGLRPESQVYGVWQETPVASAARTASGDSGIFTGYGPAKQMIVQLNSAAGTGTTPSMTVIVEDSVDGTNWSAIQTFTAVTTTASVQVARITSAFANRLRVRWTITGTTPSFTFDVRWELE